MDGQLTKNGSSDIETRADEATGYLPEVEKLRDEELEALLLEADRGVLYRPVPRKAEIFARITSRLVVDILAILGAMWLAYYLRFESPWITSTFNPESVPSLSALTLALFGLSPILLMSMKICGMYDTRARVRILDRIPRIIGSVNIFVVSLLLASFLLDTSVLTRGFLVFFWLFLIVFIFAGRFMLQLSLSLAGISDVVMRNTLIVGSGKVGKEVARKLVKHDRFGLRPVGFIDDDPLYTEFSESELEGLRVLGRLGDLCHILTDFEVEKVIIAFSGADSQQLLDLASKCNKMGVECSIVPRLFEVITNEIVVNEIGGIPLIKLREKKIEGYKRVLKAMEDYLLGAIILLITWPILAAAAIAIKLDSPGPVFFKHKRVGKKGRCFYCLKFRSMVDGASAMQEEMVNEDEAKEHGWLCWKDEADPRITRVGRFIRKFSIDELPQIFNVLSGHMSLVGPRPHIKEEVEQYKEWHKQRLNAKPGITGLWQVSGRSDLPFDEMIKLDLFYIERWSLWMDFKILLRTVTAVISGNGAY